MHVKHYTHYPHNAFMESPMCRYFKFTIKAAYNIECDTLLYMGMPWLTARGYLLCRGLQQLE